MRVRLISLLALFLLLGGVCPAATASDADNPALQADIRWVHLIDAGNFQAAWDSAAKMLQHAVSEPAFAKSISDARAPLGAPGTRTLLQVKPETALPGAPDGHYTVAQYQTDFANRAHAVETIISAQEPDGSWHVAGYFIR